jgi:hypothetical protein
MIHRSPAIPFIDVENDIAPDAYHTFEVVPTTYILEGTSPYKPRNDEGGS